MAPVAIVRSNRGIKGHRAAAAYLFPILHISSFTFHYCFFYSSVLTSVNIFITPLNRVSALLFIYLYCFYISSKYTAMCLCILYTIFEQELYRGTKNFTYYLSYFCYLYSPWDLILSFISIQNPHISLVLILLLLLLTISTNLITILHTSAEPPFPITTLYTSYFYLLFFLLLFRFFLHFAVVPFWVNFP